MTSSERLAEAPSLAQIVAALSVTYRDEGVLVWLSARNKLLVLGGGSRRTCSPFEFLREGRSAEVADAVRRIGDADPSDFTVTERVR